MIGHRLQGERGSAPPIRMDESGEHA